MSLVCVTNVVVGRNPSRLTDPFELEVSFECLEELNEDLEWKLTYVGDPEDKSKDQELDCVALGPIQRGGLRFVFVAEPPDYTKINKEDINGITIILLTGSYRNQEFVRVGWYVHNSFPNPEYIENPPDLDEMSLSQMLAEMKREILSEAPRVTRFQIEWDVPTTGIDGMMLHSNFGAPGGKDDIGWLQQQQQQPPTSSQQHIPISEELERRLERRADNVNNCGAIVYDENYAGMDTMKQIQDRRLRNSVGLCEDTEMS